MHTFIYIIIANRDKNMHNDFDNITCCVALLFLNYSSVSRTRSPFESTYISKQNANCLLFVQKHL